VNPRSHLLRRAGVTATAALAAGAALVTLPAWADPDEAPRPDPLSAPASISPEARHDLRRAWRATERFRDVDKALAAGYQPAAECEDDPKLGAMGVHYAHPDLVAEPGSDVERPEVLVYEPGRHGGMRLVAIEYLQADADQDLDTDQDRPTLFDLPFDGPMHGHAPGMPKHYDLHVWLYQYNPAGLFAMWNRTVRCPDSAETPAPGVGPDGQPDHGGHGA
jgi:hypothetical protein